MNQSPTSIQDGQNWMKNLQGTQIDKYRIESSLGRGGMGSVYLAQDVKLNRQVAVKIIHPSLMSEPQFKSRFLQEAQTAANLDHPSIIKIYDFNDQDDTLYMVMELIPQGNLLRYMEEWQIQRKQIPLSETLYLLAQVAEALGYAHERGIIHRDVKPDNILLKELHQPERPGEPAMRAIVVDFGLAKLQKGGLQTEVSMLLGTLPYISPEQLKGSKPDGRTDLYALGIVLYEMVTGKLPFEVKTVDEAFQQHCYSHPQSPRLLRADLPAEVEEIIMTAVAKEPPDRYQDGADMAAALRRARNNLATQMEAIPEEEEESQPKRFQAAAAAAVAAVKRQPSPLPISSSPAEGPPELIITRENESPHSQVLTNDTYHVGRSSRNDIMLAEDSVSSRHLQISKTAAGWQVTDLDSTNGTLLGNTELKANVPVAWPAGKKLIVGPFSLVWQTAVAPAQPQPISPSPQTVRQPSPPAAVLPPQPLSERLSLVAPGELAYLSSIRLEPLSINLAPGAQASVQAHMYNESDRVDHFTVAVDGLPSDWVTFSEKSVQLMPNTETTFRFNIRPPVGDGLAKTYPYRLVLKSTSDEYLRGIAFGNVLIDPAPRFTAELNPPRIKNSGNLQVIINNQGNTDERYAITGTDNNEAVLFDKLNHRLRIPAGHEGRVNFRLKPIKRPLTGSSKKSLPVQFQIVPSQGDMQTQNGQIEVSPRLPRWLLAIIMMIFLGSAFIPVISVNSIRNTAKAELQRQVVEKAEEIRTTEEEEERISAESATATAEATAEAAVVAAATATRVWELSDPDGDGLTNEEETNLGTNLEKADTDGDGLLDGDEINADRVKRYGTDPINPDTDNDGLSDGEEVNGNPNASGAAQGQFTDPSHGDTDGDGEPDGVDADSGSWPTPTPLPEENLLTNPSFEMPPVSFKDAHTNAVYQELRVPAGWHLVVHDKAPVDAGEGVYVFPEMIEREKGVLNECNGVSGAPPAELCSLFDKEKILKVFKGPGLPVRFGLYQEVFLEPGAYNFTITYFANSIWYEEDDVKRFSPFEDNRAETQLCITGAEYDHEDWQPVETGKIVTQEIKFIVPEAQNVTLYAKFRNRFEQTENGWFFDHWTLQKIAVIDDVEAGVLESNHDCDGEILQPGVHND
ncbi:MAG: protein kinase [Chloroflexi bacterium]|nr:protein kinase [Chloroflexota bacterium]